RRRNFAAGIEDIRKDLAWGVVPDRFQVWPDVEALPGQTMTRGAVAFEDNPAALRTPRERGQFLVVLPDDFGARARNVPCEKDLRPLADSRVGMLHQQAPAHGTDLPDANSPFLDLIEEQRNALAPGQHRFDDFRAHGRRMRSPPGKHSAGRLLVFKGRERA